jgi:hypothetical protein
LWLDMEIILRTIPALVGQGRDIRCERKRRAASPLAMGSNLSIGVRSANPADGFAGGVPK